MSAALNPERNVEIFSYSALKQLSPIDPNIRPRLRKHRLTVESDTRSGAEVDDVKSLPRNLYDNAPYPEVQIANRKIYGACTLGAAGDCAPGYTNGYRWPDALQAEPQGIRNDGQRKARGICTGLERHGDTCLSRKSSFRGIDASFLLDAIFI
jgi:hypothetical protein